MLLALLFASVMLVMLAAPAAHADEVDTDKYDYVLAGNVQFDSKPLENVKITVTGPSTDVEVKTDAAGQWKVGVPESATYSVTLDEETLPKGVIVAKGGDTLEAEFGLTKTKVVNFFLGEGERTTVSFFDQFVNRFVNGINFGLLLALAAIGLSLIYGTTGLSNFAHAELITFGGIMAVLFSTLLGLPIWLGIGIALVLSAGLGWGLDAALWKPLRRKGVGVVPLMIVSIGLSVAMRYGFQYFFGGDTRQLPGASMANLNLGPISLSWIDIASMITSTIVLLLVGLFLLKTRIGKATRAVSDNPSLASASGIDVDHVIRIVWVLGAALAGLSGILWAYFRPGVTWDMGFQLLLLVFSAVVLGGLGTAFGALIGALIVGVLVELSTLWIPSDLKYVSALFIMIIVLLFRPEGILGRKQRIG